MAQKVKIGNFTYDFVGKFSDGIAPARQDDGWFHIREDGSPLYTQRYVSVGQFSEGFSVVCICVSGTYRYYHIDCRGRTPYKRFFKAAGPFLNRRAKVTTPGGKDIVINPDGGEIK